MCRQCCPRCNCWALVNYQMHLRRGETVVQANLSSRCRVRNHESAQEFSKGGLIKTAFISRLVVTAIVSSGVALVEPQSSAASHLSHKQANRLINTARTSQDHLELARYFRHEAQRNRDKQAHYLETAWNYRLHRPRVDMYRNVSTSDAYRHWADEARRLALADEQLAAVHEQMALQLLQGK